MSSLTQIIKAREVEVSFVVDKSNHDEVMNIDHLRRQGAVGFKGKRVDVKLTDYLTVHNVLAIESVKFAAAHERHQDYLHGEKPKAAHITFRFIIDGAKSATLAEEHLIEAEQPVIGVSSTQLSHNK